MKNTKIINRLIDYYLEGSELTQDEHNTVRSLKEEMQAINYIRCCKSDSESLFTQEQFDYVMNVPEIYLRSHLLHQVRLRDNMEADRNEFEKMYNELLSKYNPH